MSERRVLQLASSIADYYMLSMIFFDFCFYVCLKL